MLFRFAVVVSICSAVTVLAQEEGDLRLIRGPNGCEGHLQVLVPNNGQLQWSSACDRRFGVEELQVACRQIGCPAGNPQRRTVESYRGRLPRGSVYQAFGFSCGGSEGKVVDCPYTGAVCDLRQNSDIIAVACLEGGSEPPTTALTAPGSLSGGYQLRLTGGNDRCQGDLEVYIPFLGTWALALSREFGNDEAAVTCSQLSCGAPIRVSTSSRTSGPYLEVGYECDGSENRLQDCSPKPLFSRSSEYYLRLQCQVPVSQDIPTEDTTSDTSTSEPSYNDTDHESPGDGCECPTSVSSTTVVGDESETSDKNDSKYTVLLAFAIVSWVITALALAVAVGTTIYHCLSNRKKSGEHDQVQLQNRNSNDSVHDKVDPGDTHITTTIQVEKSALL